MVVMVVVMVVMVVVVGTVVMVVVMVVMVVVMVVVVVVVVVVGVGCCGDGGSGCGCGYGGNFRFVIVGSHSGVAKNSDLFGRGIVASYVVTDVSKDIQSKKKLLVVAVCFFAVVFSFVTVDTAAYSQLKPFEMLSVSDILTCQQHSIPNSLSYSTELRAWGR